MRTGEWYDLTNNYRKQLFDPDKIGLDNIQDKGAYEPGNTPATDLQH